MRTQSSHPYRVSAAHAAHVGLNAKWDQSSDWRIPHSYGDPEREACAARAAVGLQDVSDWGKLDVKGAAVEAALALAAEPGGAATAILRIKTGSALILTRRNAAPAVQEYVLAGADSSQTCLHITDVTSALAAYVLVGPRAADVLSKMTALDLRAKRFPEKSCAQCDVARVHATIFRDAWEALPVFVVLVGRDVGEYVWTAISTAGKTLNLAPIGTAAACLLHGLRPGTADAPVNGAVPNATLIKQA